MLVACLDLEGVLVPEIWINVAKKTGIAELERTTRDEPDYDKLMRYRLDILAKNQITLADIQEVISSIEPLPGAVDFLNWLRSEFQVIILSDTFYEFGMPLMRHLGFPTLFCHNLVIQDGFIIDYRLRQNNQKQQAVKALQSLNLKVIASGDSYNDANMLGQAEAGILFSPAPQMITEFPQFPAVFNYADLQAAFLQARQEINAK